MEKTANKSPREANGMLAVLFCFLLLLSGDIQLNPGPLRNSAPGQDVQLNTAEKTLVWHDHTRGTEPMDMLQMESLFAELQQPVSDSNLHPDECGLRNQTGELSKECLHQNAQLGPAEAGQPDLPTESELSRSCYHMETRRKYVGKWATSKSCTRNDRSAPGHVEGKQKQFRFFQTVNHAKVIWDTKTKPKGIVGGHLNIRSIISKRDQVQHLLTNSNLDYLCLTESWLNCNIPTHIDVPGYVCFRKDRLMGWGDGALIYIRDTFKCSEINLDTPLEYLAINVMPSTKMKFNIVTLYNPPSHGASFYQDLNELLKQLNWSCETVFLGDYNTNKLNTSIQNIVSSK